MKKRVLIFFYCLRWKFNSFHGWRKWYFYMVNAILFPRLRFRVTYFPDIPDSFSCRRCLFDFDIFFHISCFRLLTTDSFSFSSFKTISKSFEILFILLHWFNYSNISSSGFCNQIGNGNSVTLMPNLIIQIVSESHPRPILLQEIPEFVNRKWHFEMSDPRTRMLLCDFEPNSLDNLLAW